MYARRSIVVKLDKKEPISYKFNINDPVLCTKDCNIKNAKVLMEYIPDSQRYFDLHHSANDVYSEVHPREMELGSAALAIMAYLISEEGL